MGSEKETKKDLLKRIEGLEKQNTWPNKLYKLFTLLGVPSLIILLGIVYTQIQNLNQEKLSVKDSKIEMLQSVIEQLDESQPVILTKRLSELQENYKKIFDDLKIKNEELRHILYVNNIRYDSLNYVYNQEVDIQKNINFKPLPIRFNDSLFFKSEFYPEIASINNSNKIGDYYLLSICDIEISDESIFNQYLVEGQVVNIEVSISNEGVNSDSSFIVDLFLEKNEKDYTLFEKVKIFFLGEEGVEVANLNTVEPLEDRYIIQDPASEEDNEDIDPDNN